MITALYNAQIISNGEILSGKTVLVENGKIKAVTNADAIPADANKINLNSAYLAPGFIDLQIYGTGAYFFGGQPSAANLKGMEEGLLAQGCTGFMATIATNTNDIVEAGIAAAKEYRPQAKGNFLGLHLEGPYLNPKRRGAHPAELIKKATLSEVKHWVDMAGGEIKIITLAPELQDAEVLAYLDGQGIVLSSGHSDATYTEAKSFIHKPVSAITHLYNAMPPMHHREPGIIPAIFEDRPYTSVVADGIHVNFTMIKLAKRELGDKLFLITDAVAEASEGTYQHHFTGDRFVMPDGTLSGSCLTMLKAVQNIIQKANISLPEAVNMATLYPAQLAKLADKGKIEVGFVADLTIFNSDFDLQGVMLGGELTMST
ncbi:N-acetylglucosamine-6-phosphate deacetylase [Mucilaginibacter boryungensis]|uniref:N-acetylglucosamine-6-phosphate deacetylase n=1 Tax=Mucilaginibacter boryungensis TaxID=768480 RepID=A0ABR9XCJ3_9SPHI|nr:N-acetylglucosamine-6-phosphate deacetylase [Mucilaginibacter boryungensis]MBE9665112.1 N-acetylglucosamine-6-phosphate deacetylase [Mucilaginibacter boryungensis]